MNPFLPFFSRLSLWLGLMFLIGLPGFLFSENSNFSARIEVVDGETGFAVSDPEIRIDQNEERAEVEVRAENYHPQSAAIFTENSGFRHRIVLQPIVEREELGRESIDQIRKADRTVFVGFVADDRSGKALSEVQISSFPSGESAETDANGFFILSVPLQGEEEAVSNPANLVFEKNGYRMKEIRNIELFPFGDWTCQVRLEPGEGIELVDEDEIRRRESPRFSPEEAAEMMEPALFSSDKAVEKRIEPVRMETAGSSETKVKVPTNIRVLLEDNSTIEYVPMELYVRRSLPQEWIASWGNYPGGEHSLRAGAVAIRTYAIGFVNNPRDPAYDICATATCQVYRPTTNQLTDAAVAATTHFVMVDSSGTIKRGLTEYSAENNSIGFGCGDGFTQPTGGCIYDPICSGEERYGHGRGLCQWGSARWATGRRMADRKTSDGTPVDLPKKEWREILSHYYPDLLLVEGAQLAIGDFVKVSGGSSRAIRLCGDGGIENGVDCPQIGTKSVGSTGVIVEGPELIASDGIGHTWWKIEWDGDGSTGWIPENWLERAVAAPPAPAALTATVKTSTEIHLSWEFSGDSAAGFRIERSLTSSGSWSEIGTVALEKRSFEDTGLSPETEYHYRVRAFNSGGNSGPSSVVSAATPDLPAEIDPISDRTVDVGENLTFTVSATAPERIFPLADFEEFTGSVSEGSVLFRNPSFSGSTNGLIETSPNISKVVSDFPSGNESSRALFVSWSWKSGGNPWLRLTTSNVATLGNPVIDFTKKFRFRMRTDRDLKVALGLRETEIRAGTPIGSNGGTSGGIEFVGASGKNGSAPNPVRTVEAGAWRLVEFDPMEEPVVAYASGNGVLESATGLGVLEHLALVPADGSGGYEVYLDDFEQVEERKILFGLGSDAPEGAAIDEETGVFSWTPSESQGGKVFEIEVFATTDGPFGQTVSETFSVDVNPGIEAPVLEEISDLTIHPGEKVSLSAVVLNGEKTLAPLSFQLGEGAPSDAVIDSETGEFSWISDLKDAGKIFPVAIQVADGGNPPNEASVDFNINVTQPLRLKIEKIGEGEIEFSWKGIEGAVYRIQTMTDLGKTWSDLSSDIAGAGGMTAVAVPVTPEDSKRFYRVLLISDSD